MCIYICIHLYKGVCICKEMGSKLSALFFWFLDADPFSGSAGFACRRISRDVHGGRGSERQN